MSTTNTRVASSRNGYFTVKPNYRIMRKPSRAQDAIRKINQHKAFINQHKAFIKQQKEVQS